MKVVGSHGDGVCIEPAVSAERFVANRGAGVWYSHSQPFDRHSFLVARAANQLPHPFCWTATSNRAQSSPFFNSLCLGNGEKS